MAKDFYETLGLSRSATDKEIRSAYRKLARKHHPDVNPNDRASETRFKEVNAAYEVLSDPDKRKKYDKYGDQWEHADQIEEMRRQQSAGSWVRNGPQGNTRFEFTDGGDFGSVFDTLFGRERASRGPRRGRDVEASAELTLEEAFRGTTRTVQLNAFDPCPTCGGSGKVGSAICHNCHGEGLTSRPRRIEVKVPAGVRTGSRVRVPAEGEPGAGGPRGDLYLVVTVLPHSRFDRKGDDLHTEVEVPVVDAVLGGEVTVPTIDGRVALTLPELTQNGRVFRLKGKGMPHLSDPGRRGDLHARVNARLPGKLSAEERRLFEQLRSGAEVNVHG